jgi:hypothetical protein
VVALIALIHAWMFVILEQAVRRNAMSSITYDLMFEYDRERRMNNLTKSISVMTKVVHMLRMKRSPFNNLAFRLRGC